MGRCTTRPVTRTHDAWLRKQRFQSGPLAIVFDECYSRMVDAKTRRDALDKAITELAATSPYVDVVERLVCLRGVSTLTAFALTVELGDWNRFRPESLGPFLGLTPSENSSGERRRQGAITKTGNSRTPAPDRSRLAPPPPVTFEPHAGNADAQASPSPCEPKPTAAPTGSTTAGTRSRPEASPARSSWSPSLANSQGTSGRSQRWSSRAPPTARRGERTGATTRGANRENAASSQAATLDPRDRHRSSSRIPGHAAPTRAYESRHRRRRQPVRSPRRTRTRQTPGRKTPARLTGRTPYECYGTSPEVCGCVRSSV